MAVNLTRTGKNSGKRLGTLARAFPDGVFEVGIPMLGGRHLLVLAQKRGNQGRPSSLHLKGQSSHPVAMSQLLLLLRSFIHYQNTHLHHRRKTGALQEASRPSVPDQNSPGNQPLY